MPDMKMGHSRDIAGRIESETTAVTIERGRKHTTPEITSSITSRDGGKLSQESGCQMHGKWV
jgi:hypothetical protein